MRPNLVSNTKGKVRQKHYVVHLCPNPKVPLRAKNQVQHICLLVNFVCLFHLFVCYFCFFIRFFGLLTFLLDRYILISLVPNIVLSQGHWIG